MLTKKISDFLIYVTIQIMSKDNTKNNYAFIDGQNLYKGLMSSKIEIDYSLFRKYLSMKYSVKRAFIYLGYISSNKKLYDYLKSAGFELVFKEVTQSNNGKTKGNVDILLMVDVMEQFDEFNNAILITSDGDFVPLIESLQKRDKFKLLISPVYKSCSYLLKKLVKQRHICIEDIVHKIKKRPADT